MPVIPAQRRQEDHELEASLGLKKTKSYQYKVHSSFIHNSYKEETTHVLVHRSKAQCILETTQGKRQHKEQK
jgi:hypothetical protein